MLHRRCQLPAIGLRCARPWAGIAAIAVVCALALLPVQMKAGANEAHPHALLQLLIDASDGVMDHHADGDRRHHSDAATCDAAQRGPDLPSFGDLLSFGGDLPIADAAVALLWLPASRGQAIWKVPGVLHALVPPVDPPPPRFTSS